MGWEVDVVYNIDFPVYISLLAVFDNNMYSTTNYLSFLQCQLPIVNAHFFVVDNALGQQQPPDKSQQDQEDSPTSRYMPTSDWKPELGFPAGGTLCRDSANASHCNFGC